MEKKTDKISMEQVSRLANSQAGQQLYHMLRQQQGASLDEAIRQAGAGDYTALQKTVEQLLSSPEGKKLAQQLGK